MATHSDSTNKLSSFIPPGAVYAIMLVGVLLMIVAIVGVLGIRFAKKAVGRFVIYSYVGIMTLLIIIEMSALIALFVASGNLSEMEDSNNFKNTEIGRVINMTYIDCCQNGTVTASALGCWVPSSAEVVSESACMDIAHFRDTLITWIKSILDPVLVATCFLGVIQLAIVIGACLLGRWGRLQQLEDEKVLRGPYTSEDGFYDSAISGGGGNKNVAGAIRFSS